MAVFDIDGVLAASAIGAHLQAYPHRWAVLRRPPTATRCCPGGGPLRAARSTTTCLLTGRPERPAVTKAWLAERPPDCPLICAKTRTTAGGG